MGPRAGIIGFQALYRNGGLIRRLRPFTDMQILIDFRSRDLTRHHKGDLGGSLGSRKDINASEFLSSGYDKGRGGLKRKGPLKMLKTLLKAF